MKPIVYVVAAVAAAVAQTAQAQDRPTTALQRCQDLMGLTIASSDIGLPTKGASVTQADRAPVAEPKPSPDGEFGLSIPERCIVQGRIEPVDPSAPPVNFNVNLPINWNGKALQSGGGGLGGAVITAPNQKASGRFDPIPLDLPYPLTLGYVTFGDDDGHQGPDVSFTKSDEALRNWASDAHKKTRDVTLTIIKAAYGRAPGRLYFTGESAGGREAVLMAQKFPRDYDGIIATSPVLVWYGIHLADNAIRDRLIQGWLDGKAISLIA